MAGLRSDNYRSSSENISLLEYSLKRIFAPLGIGLLAIYNFAYQQTTEDRFDQLVGGLLMRKPDPHFPRIWILAQKGSVGRITHTTFFAHSLAVIKEVHLLSKRS